VVQDAKSEVFERPRAAFRTAFAGALESDHRGAEANDQTRAESATTRPEWRAVSAAADSGDLHGVRVLVIDNSSTVRRAAEGLLTEAGCEVRTAADGFAALGTVLEFQPDLVLVDSRMPRLDGYRTCALIKANPLLRHTPVVMLSSKAGLFDRAKGRLVGADLHLAKPFSREALLDAVRRCPGAVAVTPGTDFKVEPADGGGDYEQ